MHVPKRKISCFLALTLILNLVLASTAIAAPWKKTPPGQEKKVKIEKVCVLKDIPGHWAEEAMTKMNLKRVVTGYEDFTFQPNKPITRAEAVAMLVRIIGLEEQARQYAADSNDYELSFKSKIPAWAKGYLAVALDNGILVSEDLQDFRPNQPAKRYEIAVLALRALENNSQIDKLSEKELNFIDKKDIPEWTRKYVSQMSKMRLMVGNPDRSFQPNKPITRAEMSIILVKMEKLFNDRFNTQEIKGVITAVSPGTNGEGTLKVKKDDGKLLTLEVSDEAIIFMDKKRVTLEQLKVDSAVNLLTNTQGIVIFISAYQPEEPLPVEDYDLVKGTLKSVVTIDKSTSIVLMVGGTEVTLDLSKDAILKLNGKSADIADLKPGQKIEAKVTDDQVVAIEAESSKTKIVGTLVTLEDNEISVRVDNDLKTYQVDTNVLIKRNGQLVGLSELQEGDKIKLEICDGVAVKILSESKTS